MGVFIGRVVTLEFYDSESTSFIHILLYQVVFSEIKDNTSLKA